ncbi:hypothetical protein UVI_02035090 [Ustilaginoidea virens]|nr:hypothetical protein UVI_02035090 [Ustilaginoidea virens]
MASHPWAKELAVAQAAVLRAARLTKDALSSVHARSKPDASPVTAADLAAQALLTSILRAEFPHDRFVGEEGSAVLRGDPALRDRVHELYSAAAAAAPGCASSPDEMLRLIDLGGQGTGGPRGRFWVMDPVDGTAGFLRGEQYAVALALVEDGAEAVAAIAYPNLRLVGGRVAESSVDSRGLGVMLSAARGHGASVTWLPCAEGPWETRPLARLPPPPDAPPSKLHVVDCDRNRASHRRVVARVCDRLGADFPGTDVWSSHVRYASLILGGGDFWVRTPSGPESWPCIWDHAGAQLIYTEVGGKATDLDNRAVDFGAGRHLSRNRGLVLARAELHEQVVAAVRQEVGQGYVP